MDSMMKMPEGDMPKTEKSMGRMADQMPAAHKAVEADWKKQMAKDVPTRGGR